MNAYKKLNSRRLTTLSVGRTDRIIVKLLLMLICGIILFGGIVQIGKAICPHLKCERDPSLGGCFDNDIPESSCQLKGTGEICALKCENTMNMYCMEMQGEGTSDCLLTRRRGCGTEKIKVCLRNSAGLLACTETSGTTCMSYPVAYCAND